MGNHADRGRGTGVGGRRRREVAPAGFESVTPWRPRKKTVVTSSVDVTRRAVRI